jgi:hypothetical protein
MGEILKLTNTQKTIDQIPVLEGKMTVTDEGKAYVDTKFGRIQITDVVIVDQAEFDVLTPIKDKFYWVSDSEKMYWSHNGLFPIGGDSATIPIYRQIITGDGTQTAFPIPHSLDSKELPVFTLTNETSPREVTIPCERSDKDTYILNFDVAPALGEEYIVLVYGNVDMSELPPAPPAPECNNPYDFTLSERVIGKWYDGRPVYQKTIDFIQMSNLSATANIIPKQIVDSTYGTPMRLVEHPTGLMGYGSSRLATFPGTEFELSCWFSISNWTTSPVFSRTWYFDIRNGGNATTAIPTSLRFYDWTFRYIKHDITRDGPARVQNTVGAVLNETLLGSLVAVEGDCAGVMSDGMIWQYDGTVWNVTEYLDANDRCPRARTGDSPIPVSDVNTISDPQEGDYVFHVNGNVYQYDGSAWQILTTWTP